MRRVSIFGAALIACASAGFAWGETPKAIVSGLVNPESVCYGPEGLVYVTEIGEMDKDGDGKVTVIKEGKAEPFATGLDDPKGIVFFKDALYVTDKKQVKKIAADGKVSVYADASAFPKPPLFLNDIAVDVLNGIFLVSDSGDLKGNGGAAYRIDDRLSKIETVVSTETIPALQTPNGIVFDGASHFILADMAQGVLYRVKIADKSAEKIAEGMPGADGLVWDNFGRFFVTSWTTGKSYGIARPGQKPILIGEGLVTAADCCLDSTGQNLLIPDMKAGTLTTLSTKIAGWEVDETPMSLSLEVAFPHLKWTGWDDGSDSGKPIALRPIVLTHAGDGSNRVFVALQQGTIHSFENSDDAKQTKVFLDITKKVRYQDDQNEEGLLGVAFHPKFKTNGQVFVFYTVKGDSYTNVVSRFRLKTDDPTALDPSSEEELMRFEHFFWNHDGGTIAFGPDGYLYIVLGDGGKGGDPKENGQNLKTHLGKVLRIDIDKKSKGKPYGIPTDNPFVKNPEAAPEIWAYGLRNVWRMAFDRKTGHLWGADVGQDLYEEINIFKAGGNYGWNMREGLHPFGVKGIDQNAKMVEPIWEYHHNLGKSITGGVVYRGTKVPELQGAYLYGDYITQRLWALRYDEKLGRVVANHPLEDAALQVMTYGEDEKGEVYLLATSLTGQGIHRVAKVSKKASEPAK